MPVVGVWGVWVGVGACGTVTGVPGILLLESETSHVMSHEHQGDVSKHFTVRTVFCVAMATHPKASDSRCWSKTSEGAMGTGFRNWKVKLSKLKNGGRLIIVPMACPHIHVATATVTCLQLFYASYNF